MQTTFFYLPEKFLKKLADDQYFSITKGSIYHIKHYVHTNFYYSSGLTRILMFNGSIYYGFIFADTAFLLGTAECVTCYVLNYAGCSVAWYIMNIEYILVNTNDSIIYLATYIKQNTPFTMRIWHWKSHWKVKPHWHTTETTLKIFSKYNHTEMFHKFSLKFVCYCYSTMLNPHNPTEKFSA